MGGWRTFRSAACCEGRSLASARRVPRVRSNSRPSGSPSARRAFRFELVVGINTKLHELVDIELLYNQIVTTQICLYLAKDSAGLPQGFEPDLVTTTAQIAEWRVIELQAFAEARRALEARYLGGHPAGFPEVSKRFDERLAEAIESFGRIIRLAELDEIVLPELRGPDVLTGRAQEIAEDPVEPARSTALEKLDEGRHSLEIATGWLRRKYRRVDPVLEPRPTQ